MIGLKSYLPFLSLYLGRSPAALYERQRALVRLGLLEAAPGAGPGSGVRAAPETVAMLLISVLATDSLSQTYGIEALARAPARSRKCQLTGARTFTSALSAVLGKPEIANKVVGVTVARQSLQCEIRWRKSATSKVLLSQFGETRFQPAEQALTVIADLKGTALQGIAESLSTEDGK